MKKRNGTTLALGLTSLALSIAAFAGASLTKGAMQAKAEDTPFYTLDTTKVKGSNSAYDKTEDVTVEGITWNAAGNLQMTPWRIGGKSLTNVDREVYTLTAMPKAVRQIGLTVGTTTSVTVNSLNLIVASDEAFSSVIETVPANFEASSTITFSPKTGTEWATSSYYKFVFNVTITNSSKNQYFQFNKVEMYETVSASGTYNVSYDANGGTGEVNDPKEYTAGQSATVLSGETLSKENYAFAGWNTAKDGKGTAYAPGDPLVVSGSTTLYAVWERTHYSVTYNPNGGTGTAFTEKVAVGDASSYLVSDGAAFSKEGYSIDGWATSKTGSVVYEVGDSITLTTDLNLYAHWFVPEPAVITGKTIAEIAAIPSADLPQKTVLYRVTGYITGWNTGNNGGQYGNFYIADTAGTAKEDSVYVYGANGNNPCVWGGTTYTFTNKKDFLTNDLTKDAIIGSKITAEFIAFYYNGTFEFQGNILSMENPTAKLVESIAVTPATTEAAPVGSTVQLEAAVSPADATNKSVEWSVDDATVASVSESGLVTGLKAGTVEVTATAKDGSGVTGSALIEFIATPAMEKIASNDGLYDGMTILIGDADGTKVMGEQKTSNRAAVGVTDSVPGAGYATFTLGVEDTKNGVRYTFHSADGYLYAASSGSNHLKSKAALDVNGLWDIDLSKPSIIAKESSNRNVLQLNSTLFSCYNGANYAAVAIFAMPQTITDEQVANTFIKKYMHMVSAPVGETGAGKCVSESWYATAKEAFNKLTEDQRLLVTNNADVYARLQAWAVANGDEMTGDLILASKSAPFHSEAGVSQEKNAAAIALIALAGGASTGALVFFLRKKKQDR